MLQEHNLDIRHINGKDYEYLSYVLLWDKEIPTEDQNVMFTVRVASLSLSKKFLLVCKRHSNSSLKMIASLI